MQTFLPQVLIGSGWLCGYVLERLSSLAARESRGSFEVKIIIKKVAGDDCRNSPAVCCWGQFAVFLTQAGNTAKCSCFSEHTRHTPSFTHTFVQLFLWGHCFDFTVQPIPYLWPTPTSACLSFATFCNLNNTVIHLYIFIFLPCVLCHCRGKPDAHKNTPHENY